MYDVVILIPVYNNLAGLKSSVASISTSSFNTCILIVDDGSNLHESPKNNFFNKGSIIILRLEENGGVTNALNYGLKYIRDNLKCKYLARLDAGDLCLNNRIEKQINFLDKNHSITFVGSWALVYDSKDNLLYKLTFPATYIQLSKSMYVNNSFVHPTLMIRWDFFCSVGFYSKSYPAAEDFELCFRMLREGFGVNLKEFLLKKVYDEQSISTKHFKKQVYNRIKIIWKFRRFNIYFFYGLFRNIIVLLIPHFIIERIKIWIK